MTAVLDELPKATPCEADLFAPLHARFLRPLQRFFVSYRLSADDVEDLTQEVFVRVAGLRRLQDLRNPGAFVFTLAYNLVRDRARRLHTRALVASVSFDEVELPCGRPTPEERLEHDERLGHAAAVLDGLRPATRRAFLLHRVHGLTHAEVAAELGISVSMVEKHVTAAVVCLRRVLV